ncbi:hypothetical protein DPMN_049371 [Dreissena polymorpha]|uniref:Uncharacterized protein n=1 Tax=Dreissena polymorpha TaxID=45954 RepID=A0A9D4HM53_DREPO|nr:hypothetical protein DPMN_049371 [Dreissena polymorpha]
MRVSRLFIGSEGADILYQQQVRGDEDPKLERDPLYFRPERQLTLRVIMGPV